MLAMSLAPKLATLADVLARRDLRRAYGGTARIVTSAFLEFVLLHADRADLRRRRDALRARVCRSAGASAGPRSSATRKA